VYPYAFKGDSITESFGFNANPMVYDVINSESSIQDFLKCALESQFLILYIMAFGYQTEDGELIYCRKDNAPIFADSGLSDKELLQILRNEGTCSNAMLLLDCNYAGGLLYGESQKRFN